MLVWVSLPCTGGSAWQDLNWRKGNESTREGIRKQWRQVKNMWNALCRIVLPRLDGRHVCMAFEWPAACSYWKWSSDVFDLDGKQTPHIRDTLAGKLRFTSLVHGCEHDLMASRGKHKGELVRKLWRIDSDCEMLVRALHRDRRMSLHERRCEWRKYPCSHAKEVFHAACAGKVTSNRSSVVGGTPSKEDTSGREPFSVCAGGPSHVGDEAEPLMTDPWRVAEGKSCSNEFVTGTIECLVCGSLQSYKMLTEEAQTYAKQDAERMRQEAATESSELEKRAARANEELKKQKEAFRGCAFLRSHTSSADGVLRTRVRKQHLHRWKWVGETPEAVQYRMEKANSGCVALAANAGRTAAWIPRSPDDVPEGEVTLSPQDIVYYLLSVMHDDAGPPQRGEQLRDSPGKRMAHLIGVFLVDHNFEVVMEKVMGNVDEAVAWMKDAYSKRKKRVREASSSQCIVDEVSDLWGLLRDAIVSTQNHLLALPAEVPKSARFS